MKNKKLLFLLAPLAVILGLFIEQPSGFAIAGLSEGFMKPISSFVNIFAIVLVGLISANFKGNSLISKPCAFMLIMIMGACVGIMNAGVDTSLIILLSVLLYALAVAVSYSPSSYIYTVIFSYIGFQFGVEYIAQMSQNISHFHYMLGVCISTILVMGAAISLALIVDLDLSKLSKPAKKSKKERDAI